MTPRDTADVLAEVLAETPDVLAELTAAHQAAVAAVSPRLLELCRLRIAGLLRAGDDAASDVVDPTTVAALASWPTSELFDSADRACLAFTEQFVIDVASIPDELANAVADELGPEGFADFVNALLVVEQRLRLRLIWGRLFAEPAA